MTYIEIGDWTHLQSAAQQVRTAVFVQEQGIAPEDEWDADDNTALHAVLFDVNGQAIGNARLLQPSVNIAKVGRMAVLRQERGHGLARPLGGPLRRERVLQGHGKPEADCKILHGFGFSALACTRLSITASATVSISEGMGFRTPRFLISPSSSAIARCGNGSSGASRINCSRRS